MNDEQYNELKKILNTIWNNQAALGQKIDALQSDVTTIINNQHITGKDQDKLIETVNKIKEKISKL